MKVIVIEEDEYSILYISIKKNLISEIIYMNSQIEDIKYSKWLSLKLPIINLTSDFSDNGNKNANKDFLDNETSPKHSSNHKRWWKVDRLFFGVFIKELTYSTLYKKLILYNFRNVFKLKCFMSLNAIIISLESKLPLPLDYSWSKRCLYLVLERIHLDSLMSWLSTLGGAFSALGDYDPKFAERASITSYKQMIIACRLGDLDLIARCWLYCALSLIQKKKFKKAASIIEYVYRWAKLQIKGKVDFKIIKMCQGIWTKLKYEHSICLSFKRKNRDSSRRV